jgi:hypothetical protein
VVTSAWEGVSSERISPMFAHLSCLYHRIGDGVIARKRDAASAATTLAYAPFATLAANAPGGGASLISIQNIPICRTVSANCSKSMGFWA